jgi:hypothetical protein
MTCTWHHCCTLITRFYNTFGFNVLYILCPVFTDFSKQCWSYLKIPGAGWVTWNRFRNEIPQILVVAVQDLVATATCRPVLCTLVICNSLYIMFLFFLSVFFLPSILVGPPSLYKIMFLIVFAFLVFPYYLHFCFIIPFCFLFCTFVFWMFLSESNSVQSLEICVFSLPQWCGRDIRSSGMLWNVHW